MQDESVFQGHNQHVYNSAWCTIKRDHRFMVLQADTFMIKLSSSSVKEICSMSGSSWLCHLHTFWYQFPGGGFAVQTYAARHTCDLQ